MADETTPPEPDEHNEPFEPDDLADAGPDAGASDVDTADADMADAGTADAGTDDDGDDDPGPASPAASASRTSVQTSAAGERTWSERRTANKENVSVLGELTICYADRVVTLPMDGDAAMRIMTGWHHNLPRVWADPLDPAASPAKFAWVVVSLEDVLAMMWMPGLRVGGEQPKRMAVDPVAA